MITRATSVCAVLLLVTTACSSIAGRGGETGGPALPPGQQTFWNGLAALCGQAFEGRVILAPDSDSWHEAERIVMHVRSMLSQAPSDKVITTVRLRRYGGSFLADFVFPAAPDSLTGEDRRFRRLPRRTWQQR